MNRGEHGLEEHGIKNPSKLKWLLPLQKKVNNANYNWIEQLGNKTRIRRVVRDRLVALNAVGLEEPQSK